MAYLSLAYHLLFKNNSFTKQIEQSQTLIFWGTYNEYADRLLRKFIKDLLAQHIHQEISPHLYMFGPKPKSPHAIGMKEYV